MSLVLPIDRAELHWLSFGSDGAVLEVDPELRQSPLRQALLEHVRVGGTRLDPVTQRCSVNGSSVRVEVGPVTIAQVDPAAGEIRDARTLSPFESRYLADNRRPFDGGVVDLPERPVVTDLHSHFAGCVRPRELIQIGIDTGCFRSRSRPRSATSRWSARGGGRSTNCRSWRSITQSSSESPAPPGHDQAPQTQ